MRDPDLDALSEAARNRGLKLVRSRVRTPGNRRFGKVGLADKKGKPVFGIDAKGPNSKPEDVAEYLRSLGAKDWGASLDVAEPQRKRTGKPPRQRKVAPNDAAAIVKAAPKPTPATQPKPPPVPKIRQAMPADVPRLVKLMKLLGHDVDAPGVRKRIAALAKQGNPQLVATVSKEVVGLVGIHAMTAIHRDKLVGRVTILIVAEEQRDKAIGRLLLEAAEDQLRKAGCGMVEITSNDRLAPAHAFYRHMGYERTSIRFAKTL